MIERPSIQEDYFTEFQQRGVPVPENFYTGPVVD